MMSGFAVMAQDAPVAPADAGKDAKGDAGRGRAEQMRAMAIEQLRETEPAKFEELKKLKQDNPEEFQKQVEEIKNKMKEKFDKEREDFKVLVDKYRETKTDEALAAVKTKMQEYAQKRIEMQKKQIAEMEKKLAEAKARIAETEKDMQAKIDERLKTIIDGKAPGNDGKDKKDGKDEKKDEKAE
ncbi:MAG TPA: hypothetical protein DCZ94_10160 [Lentisphaeria bacterium]|nr:hypothetical protein [Lentisphaeria bacterium]